jgi:large subunit ribosomal protein L21
MQAIVKIGNSQYKIYQGRYLYVDRMDKKEGEEFFLDQILLIQEDEKIKIGTPILEGISIKAKVLEHLKGDKVIVFKKKRRKGYKVKRGYRHSVTKIECVSIEEKTH